MVLKAKADITSARVLAARAASAVAQTSELQDRALLFLAKQAAPCASLAKVHSPGISANGSDGAGGDDGEGGVADDQIEWVARDDGAMIRLPGNVIVAVTQPTVIVQVDDEGAVFEIHACDWHACIH